MNDEVNTLKREVQQLQAKVINDVEIKEGSGTSQRKKVVQSMEVQKELITLFGKNNFDPTNKTKKAVEFTNKGNGEIIYLLPNKKLTIVLHPDMAKERFTQLNTPRLSTAFRGFPRFKKDGEERSNYGYPFEFDGIEELNHFLEQL